MASKAHGAGSPSLPLDFSRAVEKAARLKGHLGWGVHWCPWYHLGPIPALLHPWEEKHEEARTGRNWLGGKGT